MYYNTTTPKSRRQNKQKEKRKEYNKMTNENIFNYLQMDEMFPYCNYYFALPQIKPATLIAKTNIKY